MYPSRCPVGRVGGSDAVQLGAILRPRELMAPAPVVEGWDVIRT